jgi:hypothetical protein
MKNLLTLNISLNIDTRAKNVSGDDTWHDIKLDLDMGNSGQNILP